MLESYKWKKKPKPNLKKSYFWIETKFPVKSEAKYIKNSNITLTFLCVCLFNNFLIMSLGKVQPSVNEKITLIRMSVLWKLGLSTSAQSKGFVRLSYKKFFRSMKGRERRNTEHRKSSLLLQETLDVLDCMTKTCLCN